MFKYTVMVILPGIHFEVKCENEAQARTTAMALAAYLHGETQVWIADKKIATFLHS